MVKGKKNWIACVIGVDISIILWATFSEFRPLAEPVVLFEHIPPTEIHTAQSHQQNLDSFGLRSSLTSNYLFLYFCWFFVFIFVSISYFPGT